MPTLVRICRWYGGKKAALSLRFDDSHPTHVTVAIPMLDEYGLAGTFMVNPGEPWYREKAEVWEGPLAARGHEIGNHTMNHRGARTDREAESEIGEATRVIREDHPEPRLMVFQRGGYTNWLQRRPMKGLLARYDLLSADEGERSFVVSCTERYASCSPAAFGEMLDRAITEGAWMKPHFHAIVEEGHLFISPGTFKELLDIIDARRGDVWSAGISAIHQYEVERDNSAVFVHAVDDDTVCVQVVCEVDERLYSQPLTLEVDLPHGEEEAAVFNGAGGGVEYSVVVEGGKAVIRFDVPPRDGAYVVSASGLGGAWRAEHGEVVAPVPHPYLFFTSEDVQGLLDKARDPAMEPTWRAIRAEADRLCSTDVGKRWYFEEVQALLLAYVLTRDPEYARWGSYHVERLVETDWWHSTKVEMLLTATAICTLGLAYDWLQEAMSDDLKQRVRATIVEHGMRPVVQATEQREWWTHWSRGNWGMVIYGQVGVAAMSLLGEEPSAADCVRLCERKVWHYPAAMGDDGEWGESAGYAWYAWIYALMFMEALRRVTGSKLFDHPRLLQFARWFFTLLEPGEAEFIPFSDSGGGTRSLARILFLLARWHRAEWVQRMANRIAETKSAADVYGFLWYDARVGERDITELAWPLDAVFRRTDWAVLRSGWGDPEATVFALKGGQKDWDHQHHDSNSFVLYAKGVQLLVDLLYPMQLWGIQTEAHNTVVVNGRDQRGRVKLKGLRGDPTHRAIVADLLSAPWYARLVGDGSMAYEEEDVRRFLREVLYLRRGSAGDGPEYFVMLDDVEATKPSRIDWLLHTYGEMVVEGNLLTVRQDEAAVDVTMVAPEGVEFEVAQKTLEEVKAPRPFEAAETLSYVKAHAPERVERGVFLSVLAPRAASETERLKVDAIREGGLVGAGIHTEGGRDVALFALDEPRMEFDGIEAVGRTCFVRREGGRVTAAALHQGISLTVGGETVFETANCGQAAIWFGEDEIEVSLDLYNSDWVAVKADREPRRVVVDGEERDFEYDAERGLVRIEHENPRTIRIALA